MATVISDRTQFNGVEHDHRKVCLPQPETNSKGIWSGHNPLHYPYPLMMAQIILVVVTSRVLYYFLRPFGQTKFVCNLLGGIIWGPSFLGHHKVLGDKLIFRVKEFPLVHTLAVLGTIYSMFLITVKIDIAMVRRTAENAWKIGLAGFIFPCVVTSSLVNTLACAPGVTGGILFLYFATFSLSFTYFPVIAEALDELNLMTSELGQLAMSSAMLNDVIQWFSMAMYFIFSEEIASHGIEAVLSLLALLTFAVYIIRPAILLIIKKTPKGEEVSETYVVAIQLGVLVMAFITDAVGTKPATGAIILGLVIPDGPPLGASLIRKTEFLVSEFLMPVFFFHVGLSVDVFSIHNWTSFTKLQVMIIVSYVAKIAGVTAAAMCCKIRFKNSLLLSLIMNIKGIIELSTYNRWRSLNHIDEQSYTQMVLSSMGLTMIVTPFVRFYYMPQMRLRQSSTKSEHIRNIQSLMPVNSETFRILCCVHNQESVRNLVTLLEASNPTQASPICVFIVHAVELVGRAAPLLVPHKRQRKNTTLANSRTDVHMMQAFENYSKNSKGQVMIEAFTMIAPYKSMHETICHQVNDKLISLIIIPFHENHKSLVGPNCMTSAIRQFNKKLQSDSPCTVGILVDRSLSCRLSLTNFSYIVAVFFVGGPDDCEALAYAARMSGNPYVGITVFRITLRNKLKEGKEEEKNEAKLDEALVDEFKLRNIGNNRLEWRDIEVDDGEQVMDTIRNSQGDYDLVMVGRRHSEMSLKDEEMGDFMENAELGLIGDMLASSDFCGGMANVLVMQESRENQRQGTN